MKKKLIMACNILAAMLMLFVPFVMCRQKNVTKEILPTSALSLEISLRGLIFQDKDMDGVLDGSEYMTNLSGMSAVLTSPSGAMAPLNIDINSDGTFKANTDSGDPYYLEIGTYQLTITNNTSLGFTPTTSSRSSHIGLPPFGSSAFYMDIPQGIPKDANSAGIAADHSYAVYTFELTEANNTRGYTVGVGIGMAEPASVTFSAESGIKEHFGAQIDPIVSVFYGSAIGKEKIPKVDESILSGYDGSTLGWRLNQDVTLSDSQFVAAGTVITNDQLAAVTVMKDLSAVASLALADYKISYDYAQGTAPETLNRTGYSTDDSFPIAIENNPTRIGYTFAGWMVDYDNSDLTDVVLASKSYSIPLGSTGDIKLTAVWDANQYIISYHGNHPDATGAMENQTARYDTELKLYTNGFALAKYLFTGWNTKPDGTGVAYSNEEAFKPWQLTEALDLYAQWTANPIAQYSINYIGNNNTGGTAPTDGQGFYDEGTTITVLGQGSLVRTGYTFAGWAATPTGSAYYMQGQQLAIISDMTLYAVWEKAADTSTPAQTQPPALFTIVYEPGKHGAFSTQTSANLKAGTATPAAPSPIGEPNWQFNGWSPARRNTVTRSVSYIAQWTWAPEQSNDPNNDTNPAVSSPASDTNDPPEEERTELVESPVQNQENSPLPRTNSASENVDLPSALAENDDDAIVMGNSQLKSWALLNLILSVLSILLTLFAILRKQKNEDHETTEQSQDLPWYRNYSLLRMIAMICLDIIGIVIFLITEDIRNTMVYFDRWTMIHILLLLLEIILLKFQLTSKRENLQEK